MKKQCIQCGHLNEPHYLRCANCPGDLLHATEVYEPPPEPLGDPAQDLSVEPDSSIPLTEQLPCDCPSPGGEPGEICFGCGGLVLPRQDATTPPDQSKLEFGMTVRLPNGTTKRIGPGVLLGRNPEQVVSEVASALFPLKGISRSHVWLCDSAHGLIVVDLGSRNGTWLHGERLLPWKSHLIDAKKLPVELRLGLSGFLQISMEQSA
jgi:hypothetical protein